VALEGNLTDFEITSLLQLVHLENKDGALKIKGKGHEGVIYFKNGFLIHAETNSSKGESAIQEILTWTKGKFEFVPGEEAPETTVNLPIPNVILEAARRIDEWKKIESVIPSVYVVVDFVEDPDVGNIEIKPEEWKLLSFVDGTRTIKEIAEAANMGEFNAAKVFWGLVTSGLVKVKGERKPHAEETQEEQPEEPPTKPKKKRRGLFGF